ncbi:hypothetical protein IQ22_01053 [Pseudomonas duriflava]|uniref:Polysaccharide biosynthesis protein n=1 Tax=Pseudomonas duriflava TaxID=459528 RepID=A0A562QIM0_9PSED|nr:lipopolysaccharide biosynthesis protein [Pseudomonas duriflava]TWI56602.1 hypothetical protein IQ22_01053 [Pseudomonas duriflava]
MGSRKACIPFAASLSFTSILWIALTQLDKVLLSKILLLREYGYFSLVALISGSMMILTNPLVQTLLPRMTRLTAQGRIAEMHHLYRNATSFACSILSPLAAVIAFHAQDLVFAWTGDQEAADWSRSVLPWYALGSAAAAIGAFPFYLQYAQGRLRMHMWYSVLSTLLSIPIIVAATVHYGAQGVALTWFGLHLTAFIVWPAIAHSHFAPGLHSPWTQDMFRIVIVTAAGLLISDPLLKVIASDNRFDIFLGLAVCGAVYLTLVAITSRPVTLKLYVLLTKERT